MRGVSPLICTLPLVLAECHGRRRRRGPTGRDARPRCGSQTFPQPVTPQERHKAWSVRLLLGVTILVRFAPHWIINSCSPHAIVSRFDISHRKNILRDHFLCVATVTFRLRSFQNGFCHVASRAPQARTARRSPGTPEPPAAGLPGPPGSPRVSGVHCLPGEILCQFVCDCCLLHSEHLQD